MIVLLIVLIIIIILLVAFYIFYKNVKNVKSIISVASNNILTLLDQKKELIDQTIELLNSKKLKNEFVYDEEWSVFDKDNALFKIRVDISNYLNGQGKKKNSDEVHDLIKIIDTIDEDIEGLKNFYNSKVLDYKNLYDKKFFNLLFKLFKIESVNMFKSRKLDDFEILKN